MVDAPERVEPTHHNGTLTAPAPKMRVSPVLNFYFSVAVTDARQPRTPSMAAHSASMIKSVQYISQVQSCQASAGRCRASSSSSFMILARLRAC